MQGAFDPKRNMSAVDLGTVRDTLGYIRDDLARVRGLEKVAEILETALAEIEAADRRRLAPIPRAVFEARLLARRRH